MQVLNGTLINGGTPGVIEVQQAGMIGGISPPPVVQSALESYANELAVKCDIGGNLAAQAAASPACVALLEFGCPEIMEAFQLVFSACSVSANVLGIDPLDYDYQQIVVPQFPAPVTLPTQAPSAVSSAFTPLSANLSDVLGYNAAFMTSVNREQAALLDGNTIGINLQRQGRSLRITIEHSPERAGIAIGGSCERAGALSSAHLKPHVSRVQ